MKITKYIKRVLLTLCWFLATVWLPVHANAAEELPPELNHESEVISTIFQAPNGNGQQFLTPKILRLTQDVRVNGGQTSAIWSKAKLDLKQDFTFKAYLYFGNKASNVTVADGITFTLQNDERMATNPRAVIGSPGFGMGVYSEGAGKPYVKNALAIEFDPYINKGTSNKMDTEVDKAGDKEHIAFARPNSNNNQKDKQHLKWVGTSRFSTGIWRELVVTWKAATKTLSYELEGMGADSLEILSLEDFFKGDQVYWGFTAATGSYFSLQTLAVTEIPQSYVNEASVKNLRTAVSSDNYVSGEAKDTIELSSSFSTQSNGSAETGKKYKMVVNHDERLTIQKDSFILNSHPVPEADITIMDTNKLVINNLSLNLGETNNLSLNTTVDTKESLQNLDSYFELTSNDDVMIKKSNTVSVKTPLREYENKASIKNLTTNESSNEEIEGKNNERIQFTSTFSGTNTGIATETVRMVFEYDQRLNYQEGSIYFGDRQVPKNDITVQPDTKRILIDNLEMTGSEEYKLSVEALVNSPDYDVTLNSHFELMETDNTLLKTSNTVGVKVPVQTSGKVSVYYKDEKGNEIADYKPIIGNIGDPYEEKPIRIQGYEYDRVEGKPKGVITAEPIMVTFIYKEGTLSLSHIPTSINFGSQSIMPVKQEIWGDWDEPLTIKDTRPTKSNWELMLKETQALTNEDVALEGCVEYLAEGKNIVISSANEVIAKRQHGENEEITISTEWDKNTNGLRICVPVEKQKSGMFKGELEWTLQDAPDNSQE